MKLNVNMNQVMKGKRKVYPTKRSMNLYFKEDRTTTPATMALYILFAVVVVFALSKMMIYDPLNEIKQLNEQIELLETQSAEKLKDLKDYDKVLEDYIRATPTQEEQSQVDIMQILDLIDSTIRPMAKIYQVSISENKVLLNFADITLEEAAMLVYQLDQSKLVTNISVDTAASTKGDKNLVEAHVYFEVSREEEKNS